VSILDEKLDVLVTVEVARELLFNLRFVDDGIEKAFFAILNLIKVAKIPHDAILSVLLDTAHFPVLTGDLLVFNALKHQVMESPRNLSCDRCHEGLRINPELGKSSRALENFCEGVPGQLRFLLQEGEDVRQNL
jgi:hypothetical protein